MTQPSTRPLRWALILALPFALLPALAQADGVPADSHGHHFGGRWFGWAGAVPIRGCHRACVLQRC